VKALVDSATDIDNRFATVPEFASLFGCHAFRDLSAQLVAMRSEECFAFLQQAQRLADDLVDRLEVTRLELGSDEFFDFIGQRRQVHT